MLRRLSEINHVTMELTPELQEKKIFLIEGLKKTYKDQYDAIQPLPYVKDKLYCVDKVFVEGGVEVCLAPELTRGTGESWERLESYKSIYTDFRIKFKRRIIQGEPGYGKSTLTLQLAYDWCNDVSDSPMNNVEILILLRLRQLGSVKSLFRAIKMFLLSHEPRVSKHEIEKIINSCSSVLIILDGYDEYPGRDSNENDDVHMIIKMELFADFDVSLTTRYLPECLRNRKTKTKRAKLTGFDDKARDEYIRKAVVGNNDEAVEKIKQRLYENSILADLCQVPLIFVMFAHMAHDERDIMKFKSVTQFFKHMIRCFYDHLKQKFKVNRSNQFYLHEMEHHELDKIAFEGLNKRRQQLSWIKTEFRQRVGPESYDQYIAIGILVEEDVVSDDSTVDNVLSTTMVRFYHKLFCEWYAAHHLVTLVKNVFYIKKTLRFLDPVDLQYLFRFACGLDPDTGKKLINHLKRLPGGDTFAILCILEQTGDVNEIMDSVKELCSRDFKIQESDSALLQRSTTQLLEIASNNDIPISCLHLEYSSIKFEGDTIILHSGIPLPKLSTLEKIHIIGRNAQYGGTGTSKDYDLLNLFRYGMKCGRVKELMFDQLQLPTSFSPEAFTDTMKTQNIQVRWRPFDIEFHLDQQDGHWEVDNNDTDTLRQLCSDTVHIRKSDDIFKQKYTIMFMHTASSHEIPIACLYLEESFSMIDAGTLILHQGLRLSCPVSVKKVVMQTEEGRKMTETEVVDILMSVQQSHMLEKLEFDGYLMPPSFSSESIPAELKSREIKVCWKYYGYCLNLQSGLWEVHDMKTVRKLCTRNMYINHIDSELLQRCSIKLLKNASYHDIPISCLYLKKSFRKIDAGDVILHSGLRLPCPVSVKKVVINTLNKGREMTETEVVEILMFVQQSHLLEKLKFEWCMLPQSIPAESIPSILKSRNVKVSWSGHKFLVLNLQSGRWRDINTRQQVTYTEYNDTDSDTSQEITDTEYNHMVTWFRDKYRDTEWQKARISPESEIEIETESQNDNEYNK
ncbi:uncharacterized protein [Apostichopus japonicus]|uniref:uncharacterized protein isoform X3 n=1 Tax=Stichopus japonicus TaxID=307972 RepID=UPI003AB44369